LVNEPTVAYRNKLSDSWRLASDHLATFGEAHFAASAADAESPSDATVTPVVPASLAHCSLDAASPPSHLHRYARRTDPSLLASTMAAYQSPTVHIIDRAHTAILVTASSMKQLYEMCTLCFKRFISLLLRSALSLVLSAHDKAMPVEFCKKCI